MLNQLENYYWRYNSATQLVNTVLKFVDQRVARFFARTEYLALSETMISNILTRPNLDMTEIRKFQVMHQWALNKVINNGQIVVTKELSTNEKLPLAKSNELKAIMNRLTRDLQFHKIAPQDLIKVCTGFSFNESHFYFICFADCSSIKNYFSRKSSRYTSISSGFWIVQVTELSYIR